jgi:hypothetical protein
MSVAIELVEGMLAKEDIKTVRIFKQYRDYNTIRRNLREAHSSIIYSLELLNSIHNVGSGIINNQNRMMFGKISFYHAIMLYAKWFKEVKGKTWLKKNDYFAGQPVEIEKTHDYIIVLRDKYIAHNEEDLLGGDQVILEIDDYKDIKIMSRWQEQILPNAKELEKFKKCIEVVHNKIDAEKIPEKEKLLINAINEKHLVEKILKCHY